MNFVDSFVDELIKLAQQTFEESGESSHALHKPKVPLEKGVGTAVISGKELKPGSNIATARWLQTAKERATTPWKQVQQGKLKLNPPPGYATIVSSEGGPPKTVSARRE